MEEKYKAIGYDTSMVYDYKEYPDVIRPLSRERLKLCKKWLISMNADK